MGRSINETTAKRLKSLQERGLECRGEVTCYNKASVVNVLMDENGKVTELKTCKKHVIATDGVNFTLISHKFL